MSLGLNSSRIMAAVVGAIPAPIFVFDEHGKYVEILGGVDRQRYHDGQHLIGKKIHDVIEKKLADDFVEQIRQTLTEAKPRSFVYQLAAKDVKGSEKLSGPEGKLWFEAHISPIEDLADHPSLVVWVAFNITELKNTLEEKRTLIEKLENASREIKNLRGILPICSYCKKIRDSKGDWKKIEEYLTHNSGANLSHGICPDCLLEHHP